MMTNKSTCLFAIVVIFAWLQGPLSADTEPPCCGGVEYDPNTEECCGDQLVDIGRCCDSKPLDDGKECCSSGPYNGKPYDPSSQCCDSDEYGAPEVRDQAITSWQDLLNCPNREANPDFTPSFNGCGSEDYPVDPDPAKAGSCAVMQEEEGMPSTSFTDACNDHDQCYSTCNATKSECDNQFYNEMVAMAAPYQTACAVPPPSYRGAGFCDDCSDCAAEILYEASTYYNGVDLVGESLYEDAQVDGCVCCVNHDDTPQ